MFHFLSTALQITPHTLLRALSSGTVTQTALNVARVVEAVEAATRESGAIPHLPSQWKLPVLRPTDARRFAPLAVWMQPSAFAEMRLTAGGGENLSPTSVSAPLSGSAPVTVARKKTWADVVAKFLREAIVNQTPPHEVRSRLAVSMTHRIGFILVGIGNSQNRVERFRILSLAQAMGTSEAEAEEVIQLWQEYHGKPLLSSEEWGMKREKVRALLSDRLREVAARAGGALPPARLTGLMRGAPKVVSETVLDVIFGAGRDLPRESRSAVARLLFGEAARIGDKTESVDYWEKFWEEEAKAFGWKIKRAFRQDPYGLFAAMDYATMAGWSLLRLERHLQKIVQDNLQALHILTAFREVFRFGGAKDNRPRRSLDEMLALDKVPETSRRKYFIWLQRWEKYAEERKFHSGLRPLPVVVVHRRTLNGNLERMEEIFRESAKGPDPLACIHHRLLAAKMFDEAGMLANLAQGIGGAVRLPAARLRLTGNFNGKPETLERNVLVLLGELDIPVKQREATPSRKAHSGKLGRRFRALEAEARKQSWDTTRLMNAIASDADVAALLEERIEAFKELMAARLRYEAEEGPKEPPKRVIRRVADRYQIGADVVRVWWERATLWLDEFSTPRGTAETKQP